MIRFTGAFHVPTTFGGTQPWYTAAANTNPIMTQGKAKKNPVTQSRLAPGRKTTALNPAIPKGTPSTVKTQIEPRSGPVLRIPGVIRARKTATKRTQIISVRILTCSMARRPASLRPSPRYPIPVPITSGPRNGGRNQAIDLEVSFPSSVLGSSNRLPTAFQPMR
jgi:hypothetical protein